LRPYFSQTAARTSGSYNSASGKSLVSRDCRVNHAVTNVSKPCALLHGHSPSLTLYCRGNEDTKYSGEVELPYGKTKAMAEKLVFEANGKKVQKSTVEPLVLQARMGGRRELVRKAPQHIC